MKKTAFMTALAILVSLTGCGEKPDNTPNIPVSGRDGAIVALNDTPPVCTMSELICPDGMGFIEDIFFIPETDGVILVGQELAAITDSSFGEYTTLPLPLGGDIYCDACVDGIALADSEKALIMGFDGKVTAEVRFPESDIEGAWRVKLSGTELFACDRSRCLKMSLDGGIIAEYDGIGNILRSGDGGIIGVKNGKGSSELFALENDGSLGFLGTVSESLRGELRDGQGEYISYISGNRVYGIKGDRTAVPLLDGTSSGLMQVRLATPISEGKIVAVESGRLVLIAENSGDAGDVREIREIRLAIAGGYDTVAAQAAEFNRSSTGYRVTITDYSANSEYSSAGIDEALKALEMDLIAGKIPDMVWIDPNEAELIAAKGAFADLYKFMDNDPIYSRDAFLQNYLKARETDGHLYLIEPSFNIKTLGAKAENVPDTHWDMAGFLAVYRGLPEDMELFETADHKATVLSRLADDYTCFVDLTNHSCDFDSAGFVELLEFADTFPPMEEYTFENSSCRNDTALLDQLFIMDPRDLNCVSKAKFCGNAAFPDYPAGGGAKFMLGRQYAIMENSPNKDGAWEYLRSCFEGEQAGFPIVEAAFERAMDAATEPYTFANGERTQEYYHDWSLGTDIPVEPMTDAEKSRFTTFIKSISRASSPWSMTTINSIVNEEAAVFFAGERSAEDCARLIQNRVETFLSEQG